MLIMLLPPQTCKKASAERLQHEVKRRGRFHWSIHRQAAKDKRFVSGLHLDVASRTTYAFTSPKNFVAGGMLNR